MDIHAVELLVKGAKDMTYSDFDSFQTYIKQLLDKKVGSLCLSNLFENCWFQTGGLDGRCSDRTEG